jgi:hypothetical protein
VVISWQIFEVWGFQWYGALLCWRLGFGYLMVMIMVMLAVELCFWFFSTGYPCLRPFVVLVIYMVFTLRMQDLADLRCLLLWLGLTFVAESAVPLTNTRCGSLRTVQFLFSSWVYLNKFTSC